jgi:hypothetical protein
MHRDPLRFAPYSVELHCERVISERAIVSQHVSARPAHWEGHGFPRLIHFQLGYECSLY